jgi:hypothetical protein
MERNLELETLRVELKRKRAPPESEWPPEKVEKWTESAEWKSRTEPPGRESSDVKFVKEHERTVTCELE